MPFVDRMLAQQWLGEELDIMNFSGRSEEDHGRQATRHPRPRAQRTGWQADVAGGPGGGGQVCGDDREDHGRPANSTLSAKGSAH